LLFTFIAWGGEATAALVVCNNKNIINSFGNTAIFFPSQNQPGFKWLLRKNFLQIVVYLKLMLHHCWAVFVPLWCRKSKFYRQVREQ